MEIHLNLSKVKRHNKSEKLFGYLKRYPKCDIRNIDMRNPKHFVFQTYTRIARQVLISEKVNSEILNNFRISERFFGYVMTLRLIQF